MGVDVGWGRLEVEGRMEGGEDGGETWAIAQKGQGSWADGVGSGGDIGLWEFRVCRVLGRFGASGVAWPWWPCWVGESGGGLGGRWIVTSLFTTGNAEVI